MSTMDSELARRYLREHGMLDNEVHHHPEYDALVESHAALTAELASVRTELEALRVSRETHDEPDGDERSDVDITLELPESEPEPLPEPEPIPEPIPEPTPDDIMDSLNNQNEPVRGGFWDKKVFGNH